MIREVVETVGVMGGCLYVVRIARMAWHDVCDGHRRGLALLGIPMTAESRRQRLIQSPAWRCMACRMQSADDCHPDDKPPSFLVALPPALEAAREQGLDHVLAGLCERHRRDLDDPTAAIERHRSTTTPIDRVFGPPLSLAQMPPEGPEIDTRAKSGS